MIARGKALLLAGAVLSIAALFGAGVFVGRRSADGAPANGLAADGAKDGSGHERAGGGGGRQPSGEAATMWTCSMHPQIILPKPGLCPKCQMPLIPLKRRSSGDDGPRVLTMSRAAKALAEIQSTQVERKYVTAEVRMVGKVKYDERRVNTISAWIPGRIDRLFVDFTGTRVSKGDHLVELYSPELLTAQQELIEAKKRADESPRERSEFLRDSNLRTLESAREKLRLWGFAAPQIRQIEVRGTASDRMTIFAPDGGIVVRKFVNEGDYVKTGSKLVTIADLTHVWVLMDAYESDLSWIRYAQEVGIETEAYPGETFRGKIAFIHPELDERTRTVKVRVNVENPDLKLKPGMFVRARVYARLAAGGQVLSANLAGKWISPMHPEILKDGPGQCDVCGMDLVPAEQYGYVSPSEVVAPIVVPVRAVLRTGRRAVVYLERKDRDEPTFEGREIELGPRAGAYYIVKSDLKVGEWVVVNGNFKIDSALQILAKPSMMSPEGGAPAGGHHHGGAAPKSPAPAAQKAAASTLATLRERRRAKLSTTSTPEIRTALSPVHGAYLDVQAALASDKFPDARRSFSALKDATEDVDRSVFPGDSNVLWTELSADLFNAAKRGAKAESIQAARAALKDASAAIVAIERAFGHTGKQTYVLMFCPMAFGNKGASWLQDTKEVRNPYYGTGMLDCGNVQQQFPGQQGVR